MRMLRFYALAALLLSVSILGAQAPQATPAAQTAPPGTVRVAGTVVDSTGGVMVAVNVRVLRGAQPTAGEQPAAQGQTDANGAFSFNLPPGPYRVEVNAVDFSIFRQTVEAAANMQPLAVTLTLAALEDVRVEVNTASNEVGVDPESSLTAQTITGEALLDLPENEDDLATYLQNLAARTGGADGGANIVIDGFTDGRLPSRDQIAEIRIVNNSFSAEGGGDGPRIEIITRTGTGKWTGSFGFTFNDESLNAANAFTGRKAARQQRNYNTTATGPVIPNKLNLGFRIQSNEQDGSSQSVRAVNENGPVSFVLSSPQVTRTYGIQNARYSISPGNTFNFSGSVTRSNGHNQGVQGFNLQSRAADTKRRDWQLQMSDRATVGTGIVHELRFQASRNRNTTTPISDALAIQVADAFTSGGGSNRSDNKSTNYQLANTLTWSLMGGKLNLRSGAQADYRESNNVSLQNYNGTYQFANLQDYCWAINFNGVNCQDTRAIVEAALANDTTPQVVTSRGLVAITGIPTRYTRTFGDPSIKVTQAEFSGFVQGDYRLSTRAQLQMGLRYQAQQHLDDYNNFAPTLGLNYQVRNSQNWRSVVRVGGRVTQQTFSMNSWQQLLQAESTSDQFNIELLNPVFDPINGPGVSEAVARGNGNSIRQRADDFRAGYSVNTSATWEQGLPKQMSLTFTFDRTRGVHNSRYRNINAPYPGTPLDPSILELLYDNNPNLTIRAANRAQGTEMVNLLRPLYPYTGQVLLMEPTGNSINRSFNVNFRTQNRNYFEGRLNFGANISYNYSRGYDDNNPVNPYNIAAEWGLSNRQHRVNSSAQVNLYPNDRWKNLRLTFTPTYNSGRPYSITLGRDENGDSSTNDRPVGVARNTETGPSNYNVNLSITKSFYVGGGSSTPRVASNYAEPQGGGGFGGGGGGGFGGGGGQRGGNAGNLRGTQISLTGQINNLFNNTQLGNYSGVLTSAFFGRANTSQSERRISLSLNINYR